MSHVWRVAWTIARRDYAAAVFSRLFVLFLCLPLILAGLGVAFGAIGDAGDGAPPPRATLAVPVSEMAALARARVRLATRLGEDGLPVLVAGRDAAGAELFGTLDRPVLRLSGDAPDGLIGDAGLLIDEARLLRALGHAPPPVRIAVERRAAHRPPADDARVALARGAQYAILVLTVMLAGRLLSSFLEERSNKVIEVLAAAVPVDAIFLGKLAGMLLFSLTCAAAWGVTLGAGALLFAPGLLAGLGAPAVGWPLFVPLVVLYFALAYLLFGAVLLGLGSRAGSPADVQTLALPTTIAQMLFFGLASIEVAHPDRQLAWLAAIVPWSSPLALAARAAEEPALWPHLAGIAWQGLWLALTIRIASRQFRRAVLKSAPPRRLSRAAP